MTPETFGVPGAPHENIAGGGPQDNARIIRHTFDIRLRDEASMNAPRDIVVINAAAALVAAGVAGDFRSGAALAADAIESGKARAKLAELVEFTNR